MALSTSWADVVRNAAHDAGGITALYASGKFRIYDGTPPATVNTALSGNTLLAELTMNATAFGASAAGVATAGAITQDASADATGTATFYRIFKSDGTTVLEQGTVGTSGCNLNLTTTSIVATQPVSVSAFTHTLPATGT